MRPSSPASTIASGAVSSSERNRPFSSVSFFFGPLAVGDVANRAGDQPPVIGLDGAQADLDREFALVLAQAVEFQAGAHRAHLGVGEVLAALLRMFATKTRRHQHIHRVAQQLGAGVAEELLGLCVDQHDAPVLACQHHRVGRGFEQRAEPRVSFLAVGEAGRLFLTERQRARSLPQAAGGHTSVAANQ